MRVRLILLAQPCSVTCLLEGVQQIYYSFIPWLYTQLSHLLSFSTCTFIQSYYKMQGRQRNVTIVPEAEVMTHEALRLEAWRTLPLADSLATPALAVRWLARRGLIRNSFLCPNCLDQCSLVNHAAGPDGVRWQCRMCERRTTIRDSSFFSRSHLSLRDIVILVYYWCSNLEEAYVSRDVAVSPTTVVDWCNFCREECSKFLRRGHQQIGGLDDNGEPLVVELDETKYFHRKYHRGQWREGHWVFGGIERISRRCFMVQVEDRSAATLEPLILQYVQPGTHIITDGWRSYRNIALLGGGLYAHSVVVHQENFVDPVNADIHTQNVENMWMRAKRKLKWQFGTSDALFEFYLHEFILRSLYPRERMFQEFLICLASNYAWQNPQPNLP